MSDAKRCCASCRFWKQLEPGYQADVGVPIGDCRHEPPRFVPTLYERVSLAPRYGLSLDQHDVEEGVFMATRFPLVEAGEWCGKFERVIAGLDREVTA